MQHWTQARLVQCNVTSVGSEACHVGTASSNQKGTVLLVIHVRRAYFYARARRRVYIELPEGDGVGPGSRQCGLLRKSLYGTRNAAQNWECELGGFLEEIGLRRGQASTCLYCEESRGISTSVNGDDVTVKASRKDAEWLIQKFKERYEIKTQMIGEAVDLNKQLQILNKTVRWSSRGLWIEADPRHVKEVIRALGLGRRQTSPDARSSSQGAKSNTMKTAPTPSWGVRRHHVPCGRGEAELLVPRLARHYVCHYEAVLKDFSAGRTRLEEHEESGTVPHWKSTGWVSV